MEDTRGCIRKFGDSEILEDVQCDGYRRVVMRTKDAIVDMRIPDHTEEEKKKLAADLTQALFEMAFPDEDWSDKALKIIQ